MKATEIMARKINDALHWYADERNYLPQQGGKYQPPVIYEGGMRARQALTAIEEARKEQQ